MVAPRYAALFAAILLVVVSKEADAATLHLVTIADTLDPVIGKSVAVDQKAIGHSFGTSITIPGAYTLVEIRGDRCRREVILATIQNLQVGPDDAVVVFYSGHGANDPRVGHYLSFPRIKGYLTRAELIEAINQKRARLGVLSTDCCNTRVEIPTRDLRAAAPGPPEPNRIAAQYRALFFDATGFVDLTSSKPGESSIGYPALIYSDGKEYAGRGGLWTSALLGAIDGLRGRVASWAEVTTDAARITSKEFQRLVPDGIDNPADPARPQMTQTPIAAIEVRAIRPTAPDADAAPISDVPLPPDDAIAFIEHPAQRLGIHGYESPGQPGLIIYATQPGSPAAKLGLERNDVVVAINGNKIRTARGFHKTLLRAEGAVRLNFRDVRTGREMTTVIELDDRNRGFTNRAPAGPSGRPTFGAAATSVQGGLRVDGAAPGSPAELVGLEPGDVITEINGRPISTSEAYFAAVAASPDEMFFTVLNIKTGQKQGMVVTLDRP